MKDKIIDEASRRILWDYYGFDNYNWLCYYTSEDEKKELRKRYTELKREFLGPYFKPSDELNLEP
jgi:hypothetical protein